MKKWLMRQLKVSFYLLQSIEVDQNSCRTKEWQQHEEITMQNYDLAGLFPTTFRSDTEKSYLDRFHKMIVQHGGHFSAAQATRVWEAFLDAITEIVYFSVSKSPTW